MPKLCHCPRHRSGGVLVNPRPGTVAICRDCKPIRRVDSFPACKILFPSRLNRQQWSIRARKRGYVNGGPRHCLCSYTIMFFIIISGAFTLSSAVTWAFLALRAPEAYETDLGLQVVHRIPKQRDSAEFPEALVQAR